MLLRILLGIALALVSAACGGGTGKKADDCVATTTVKTEGATKFVPACAKIAPGATLTWRNTDGIPHTVTFTTGGDFDKYFEKDEKVERTFDAAATFAYYCKVHGRAMAGKVVVQAP